jgi:uncharacterized SAM-binding protein YcdF (DUF218 family)
MAVSTKFFGVVNRKERWGLSARGWAAIILFVVLALALWVRNVQPFLAQTHRVDSRILVMEGWVHQYVARATVREFDAGHYVKIYTTGGPVTGTGDYFNDFNTSASVGEGLLLKLGMSKAQVQMVPSREKGRDRTYSSAVALRQYFRTNGLVVKGFNVVTEDAHARRTRMLFQEAFGPDVAVGIISVPDPDYEPARWWRYSEGVRNVLGESIAWCYAEFIFRPPGNSR